MVRFILLLMVCGTFTAGAQTPDSVARPRAQPFLPVGSLFLPGLGQYVQHRPAAGAAFTGAGIVGLLLFVEGDTTGLTSGELPLDGPRRRAFLGAQLYQTAGELSAYDTFRHSAQALRAIGRYRFLTQHEPMGRLLTAPFDPTFLKRWTTWVGLAYTGGLALAVSNDPNRIQRSLTSSDVAFGSAVSLNAGIGEEALFRGWLYPVLYQGFGERFWPSNGLQSVAFGALHPHAGWFMVAIAGWAFYQGWLTRRNGWSVRESVFQHVWYDVVATLVELGDARQVTLSFTLPLPAF